MDIQIKEATVEQLNEIMNWRMEVLSEVFADWKQENRQAIYDANLQYYKEALMNHQNVTVFAETNGKTVGCGSICLYQEIPSPDNSNGLCTYLMNIYTRKAYRRRGVAKNVVKYLVNLARARNINKIYLETSKNGRAFYEKLGFVEMKNYLKMPKGESV